MDGAGSVLTYNGATWSSPVSVDSGAGGLIAVSCPSTTFCEAIDPLGTAFKFNGASWEQFGDLLQG